MLSRNCFYLKHTAYSFPWRNDAACRIRLSSDIAGADAGAEVTGIGREENDGPAETRTHVWVSGLGHVLRMVEKMRQ